MFDKDKLESAFNVTVKYGFCSDCRWEFDSEKCHQFDCYENSVKIIREAIDFVLNNEPVKHGYIVIKPRVIGGFVNHKCPNPQCKHEWQTDEKVKISEMLCSECGKVLAHNYQSYCPYCGAKLDGESND